MKQAVVLLSGGLDSATTLYIAKKEGYKCHALSFDYGQRHKKELGSALMLAKKAGAGHMTARIRLPWKGSSLLDKTMPLPARHSSGIPSTYVPARNTIFLSFALSYAEAACCETIFIGAHSEDYSGYPDCRKEFFDAFSVMKDRGTKYGKRIKIKVPLLFKTKREIIRIGQRLGVPFGLTWSCYDGRRSPCGKCESCLYRSKGFKEAGIEDPLL